MPTRARRLQAQKKHQIRIWAIVGTVVMAVAQFIFPGSEGTLISALVIVFAVSVPLARNGYVYAAKWYVWVPILVAHVILLGAIGWWRWPQIRIRPKAISFSGMSGERFYLSAKNETDSDAYLVAVPIKISKGLLDRVGADYSLSRQETAAIPMRYAYCIGTDGYDYLVLNFPHLQPGETQGFTVFYTGGLPFKAVPQSVISVSEPIATNDGMGRFGTFGMKNVDRCKFNFGPLGQGYTP